MLDLSLATRQVNTAKQWGQWDGPQLESIIQIEQRIDSLSNQIISNNSCCITVKMLKEKISSLEKLVPVVK